MKKIILIASFCFTATTIFSQKPYKDSNGKYGFKLNDKIIIEARFDNAYNFQDGYAIVSISSEKDKGLGVIDIAGKEIIEPKLENEKITFKDGIFYVKIQGTKEEKTFNNKGEVIFIIDSLIITQAELLNSVMSNSTGTTKEPTLQETRDKIFEDLRDNGVKGASTGSDIGNLSEFTTPPPNYKANAPTKAKEYNKVSSSESSINYDDFCKELHFILTAIEKEELGDIVDYKKPLGITQSWFSSKVNLTGFENLQGQSLFSNLSFVGYLTNSDTSDNDTLYKKLVAAIEGCLVGYTKEKNEYNKGITFVNKNNKKLKLKIDFYGSGKSIEISFRN